jgi:DNA-binding PadR family transcriptional regulator
MAHTSNLGELEQLILLAILRLGEDAYGVTIRAELSARAKRAIAPGALYTALERLETKGLVTSRMGDPTPQRGGRAKRYVKVSAPGLRALQRAQYSYERLRDGLDQLRGGYAH